MKAEGEGQCPCGADHDQDLSQMLDEITRQQQAGGDVSLQLRHDAIMAVALDAMNVDLCMLITGVQGHVEGRWEGDVKFSMRRHPAMVGAFGILARKLRETADRLEAEYNASSQDAQLIWEHDPNKAKGVA